MVADERHVNLGGSMAQRAFRSITTSSRFGDLLVCAACGVMAWDCPCLRGSQTWGADWWGRGPLEAPALTVAGVPHARQGWACCIWQVGEATAGASLCIVDGGEAAQVTEGGVGDT